MKQKLVIYLLLFFFIPCALQAEESFLASWNDGPAKKALTEFVTKVTAEGSPGFIPAPERIAVLDNDGTLWCEQPMYFQFLFAVDRIREMAPAHPEFRGQEPFKSVLAGDMTALAAEKAMMEIVTVTHSGLTTDGFALIVKDWLKTARHPRYRRPFNELVYQPMIEVLAYLRAHGFKTFIVSGGGVEFVRAFAEDAYGIPPEQVIGSSGVVRFEMHGDKPVLVKEAKIEFVDDGPGKPVAINRFIGRKPIMAFGNSDGDLQMLQWTAGASAVSFALIVHHTDAEREYAYDRGSKVGRLDKALDEAQRRGWTVVDMKKDWKTIFRD